MIWYKKLYVGSRIASKKNKIIRKLETGVGTSGIYVITLAANPHDALDVFSAACLQQPVLRRGTGMVVGIAKGYDEAIELVWKIAVESYQATGQCHIRQYILEQEESGVES